MTITQILLFLVAATWCVSYGWAMRGTLLGGEKGAMLPGCIMGILLVIFSDSDVLMNNWHIVAAVGLMAMSFGGNETYGETIGLALNTKKGDKPTLFNKGTFGLCLKGFNWFGIAGGLLSFAFSVMTGKIYDTKAIIIFFILSLIVDNIGIQIFNKPYNKEKGKFPKIYFSATRREEWGGNLLFLLKIIITAMIHSDYMTAIVALISALFGAVGWFIAIACYFYTRNPKKNGKLLFHKLSSKGHTEGWKLMEYTLGGFGGFGIALGFSLCSKTWYEHVEIIEKNGIWRAFENADTIFIILTAVSGLAVLLITIIAETKLAEKLKLKDSDYVLDSIERPFYNVLPLCLVLLGSTFTAHIFTLPILFLVAAMKCAFDRYKNFKHYPLWVVGLLIMTVLVFVWDIINKGFSMTATWIFGGVGYLLFEWIELFSPPKIKAIKTERKKGVHLFKLVNTATLWMPFHILVYTLFIFLLKYA